MELQELKSKLLEDIENNNLEDFFNKSQQFIYEASPLQNILTLLSSRNRKLKMDTLQGIISYENQQLESNRIIAALMDLVSLMSWEDIKIETVEESLATLLSEIESLKKEFQKNVADKQGVIKIGQDLINLGSILREKPAPDDVIPYEEKIKIGAKKGVRRLKIGFLELRELKNTILIDIKKMIDAYSKLVEYLDFPKEDIGETKLNNIQFTVNDLSSFIKRIKTDETVELEQFSMAKNMFEKLMSFQDQLGKDFVSFFQSIKEANQNCEEILVFLNKNNNELAEAKSQLQSLLVELQLNIKEKEF